MSPILRYVLQHVTRGGRSFSTDFLRSFGFRHNFSSSTVSSGERCIDMVSRCAAAYWGYYAWELYELKKVQLKVVEEYEPKCDHIRNNLFEFSRKLN